MAQKNPSREEILAQLSALNKASDTKGLTRGGRSSGQGVKLLYIRDFLYAEATKEHPKNARHIKEFLASKNIEANEKTIYNDILAGLSIHSDFSCHN